MFAGRGIGYVATVAARRALSIVLCSLLALAACGTDDDDTSAAATTQPPDNAASIDGEPVLRQVLGELDEVPGAPDRTLSLVRYEIAPGAELPVHIHPGVQMAWIDSGTLTYTVESGTALVRRAGTETDEDLSGPTATDLEPGDAVIELEDMVHFGANHTDEPVVILATLLTETGEDLAVEVAPTRP